VSPAGETAHQFGYFGRRGLSIRLRFGARDASERPVPLTRRGRRRSRDFSFRCSSRAEPLLTEGDLDRGQPPDVTSPNFRCGIVDRATGAVCTRRPHEGGGEHQGFAAVTGGGRDRRVVAWSGGDERAMVVEQGYTWTRVSGADLEVQVLANRPVALRYRRTR
jgi:hypothetical protein